MNKQLRFFIAMVCMCMNSFSQTLDQSNTPANAGGGGFVISPSDNVGQSFLAGLTGELSQINVNFQNFSFSAGDFLLTIYEGDGYGGGCFRNPIVLQCLLSLQ